MEYRRSTLENRQYNISERETANSRNKNTHEPGARPRFTQPRLHLPLLVYAWHYSAGPMIYTGCTITRRNHRRSLLQPRRSICRRALPSCASAAQAPRTLWVCGGPAAGSECVLVCVSLVCGAFTRHSPVGHGCVLPPFASRLQVYTLPCEISQLPSMKDS